MTAAEIKPLLGALIQSKRLTLSAVASFDIQSFEIDGYNVRCDISHLNIGMK